MCAALALMDSLKQMRSPHKMPQIGADFTTRGRP